jgi:hypothetical protein
LAVTNNFTINDGLELELDKMMTSFFRRCRFAPTTTPSSYTRLILSDWSLSLLLAASRRRRSNDTSLLQLGFGRSQGTFFADADFIPSRSTSTAVAFSSHFRVACDIIFQTSSLKCRCLLRDVSPVLLSGMFYRRWFATVISLLPMRNSTGFAHLPQPTAATRPRSNFFGNFFFLLNSQRT